MCLFVIGDPVITVACRSVFLQVPSFPTACTTVIVVSWYCAASVLSIWYWFGSSGSLLFFSRLSTISAQSRLVAWSVCWLMMLSTISFIWRRLFLATVMTCPV